METSETKEEQLSDEEMRKLLKPAPSYEEVLLALQKSYAETGEEIKFVTDLESYDERNFWIEIDNKPYLVKVHNGVESKDLIELSKSGDHTKSVIHMQNTIMEHLSKNNISTSSPIKPLNTSLKTPGAIHSLPVASKEHSPADLVVRLLSWVEGTTMSSAKVLPLETLADAGRFLGRLSVKLSELDTSELVAAKRFHQWDGKNTMGLKDFVHCIQDPRRKALVESVLQSFQKDIIDSKAAEKFPQSIIHGDFNDANMLIDSNFRISGVIDFGDSVESWRVLDLTVAMAYAMLSVYARGGKSISAAAAFLRGFHAVCPLQEEERKHLVLLIACRLSCSVTLGAYSYQQNPENEYLLLHATPAWDALDLIWGTDDVRREEMGKALTRVFDQACAVQVDPDADFIDCSDLAFPDPRVGDPLREVRTTLVDDGRASKRRRSTFK